MKVYYLIKPLIEFLKEIKNSITHKGTKKMKAFGLNIEGQGYMISSYQGHDEKIFLNSLKKEIDFIKEYKGKTEVNIVDAGANLGLYSIGYSFIKGTNIFSFEPFPETYKHLEKNVLTNNI